MITSGTMSSSTLSETRIVGAAKRRAGGSFEGVSLAAYRRLLGSALRAAEAAGIRRPAAATKLCAAGVPPHLAKVYEIWPGQQKRSMEDLGKLLSAAREEVSRLHAIFSRVRGRLGNETLEAVFRVFPEGDIRPCREMDGEFSEEEKKACRMIYSLYTLGIGASPEVHGLLSRVLTQKLSPVQNGGRRKTAGGGVRRVKTPRAATQRTARRVAA